MNGNLALAREQGPATPIGVPALCQMAFDGEDLTPVWNKLVLQVKEQPHDAAALLDLSAIAQLQGRPQDGVSLQAAALRLQRIYRRPAAVASAQPLRLLAFMAPGDFMTNTPLEFMLEGSSITLDMLYIVPGMALPDLPEHDVAIVAIDESDGTAPVLQEIAGLVKSWPRPLINAPERIAQLTRAGAWELLKSAPGVTMPMNARIGRTTLESIGAGEVAVEAILDDSGFPIIARPFWSQGGVGLEKLDTPDDIEAYLNKTQAAEFYIAPFVDYRSADGQYRKARIVLIEGRPFVCHMAISQNWMIHYLNANMRNDAAKRAEEARFMANFDSDFAIRHATAFEAIAERTRLDYLPIDCGETADGKLLVFEVGTAMIVHSMDPPELFPYKPPQMKKVFGAFQAMLYNAAHKQAAKRGQL